MFRPRAWLCAASLVLLLPLGVRGQEPTAPPASPTPVPEPVPLPDIAKRGDDTLVYLKELEQRTAPGPEVEQIAQDLRRITDELDVVTRRIEGAIAARPAIGTVEEVYRHVQHLHDTLTGWATGLTGGATVLEQEIGGLDRLREIWRVTRELAQSSAAPPAVMERIRATAAAVQQTRKRIAADRERLLLLQDRVVQQAARSREIMDRLDAYQTSVVGNLLVPDAPAIWAAGRWRGSWAESGAALRAQLGDGLPMLRAYVAVQLVRLPWQLVLFGVLWLLWRRARQSTTRWLAEDTSLASVAVVFEHPVSAAFFLTLIATPWIYPQVPLPLLYVARIAAVPPLLRVLARLVERPLLPGLYALGLFFVVDQVRHIVAGAPLIEHTLFLFEMLGGGLVVAWLLRSGRLRRFDPPLAPRTVARLERIGMLLLALFGIAFIAAALGFMQLARLAAATVLGSAYAAMLLFALGRFAAGVWAYLLRTRTLRRLRAVEQHRALLQQRGERALIWLAGIAWVLATLDVAGVLRPLRKSLARLLGATLSLGSVDIALGDVLAFALTVWLSFVVSRFARFLLEEEIFPRVRLGRGLPYAFANILHYAILLIGFLIALAASGINLDRFALLAGAFGVGIGFGLQNVVNNFVSGLILLFERPVQVGDTVQIGATAGEVRRIGIRSSMLRTFDGAEVIVPNATFISDTVTNWTLSDRLRRIDIPLTVPGGADPERVLELLRGVAAAHQLVLKHPPPVALFTTLGDRLGFELRCWTDRFEQWTLIRSELAVEIAKALAAAGIGPAAPLPPARPS